MLTLLPTHTQIIQMRKSA